MYLKKFNIESSEVGIRKLIVLIWSKDKAIKEEVILTYWSLYIDYKDNNKVAWNIINLLKDLNISELTSIEELLNNMLFGENSNKSYI